VPGSRGPNKEASLLVRYLPHVYRHCPSQDTKGYDGAGGFGATFGADRSMPVDHITDPAVIVDIFGRILTWNLPEVLSAGMQELMWNDCQVIAPMLLSNLPKTGGQRTPSWRFDHFRTANEWTRLQPGIATFSPAWFAQGNDV
jgi:hypothetical protein